jgi:hypothetical protein
MELRHLLGVEIDPLDTVFSSNLALQSNKIHLGCLGESNRGFFAGNWSGWASRI